MVHKPLPSEGWCAVAMSPFDPITGERVVVDAPEAVALCESVTVGRM